MFEGLSTERSPEVSKSRDSELYPFHLLTYLLVDEVLPVLDDDVRFIFQFVSRGGVDLSDY